MELIELILVLATVVSVADANTILIKDDADRPMTVKLACINTPKTTSQQSSLAATQRLKQLLPPQVPVVIRSTEKLNNGRTIGEVFVDNRSINLLLVQEGNAVVDRDSLYNCYETKTQYLIAEANAKNKRLGLWQQSNKKMNESKTSTLRGKLVYETIPQIMSSRAYEGNEFFLITNSPKQNRLVLRPSVQVSHSQLRSLNNKEVEITAVYVAGSRPSPTKTACPIEFNGQCMPQGEGYQVLSIVQLK
ncbi:MULTISPECIES: thermonuclease family protein [Nostoc]|uniref:Thermonuclease family protein n=1 Tax=Nostoc paludosum FACHB-159 TaxID=2692908 RepID=A0ABR8KFN5_9NOSO|nr:MULTISPECIES: thermonuclease family protein [Nostoc]MBD2681210.1 thermonuclease family protein [Nostoc sp. FACHB-857]MBD2737688.1 thermonuclease family protein [Nostoc paludosum FACHB-159]